MKNLIVYYSRKGQNYVSGVIEDLPKGNTEIAAEYIQEAVGGDLFEIDTVKPYPADYTECTDVAKVELRQRARPEIKEFVDNMDQYDHIFLGYPNWWGTAPMAVFTFLEHYDLKGKKIHPFCTNEGSGLGGSVRMIKQACPGADVTDGLAIHGTVVKSAKSRVASWATKAYKLI